MAPFNRESGSYKGGQYQIRRAMFMAMITATKCNSVLKQNMSN
ncbi:MAG: hypothetical protein KAH20_16660 [Methylococcales bacterium]|nr:hypothetical protein [Methylococcales bacterium]